VSTSNPATSSSSPSSPFIRGLPPKSPSSATSSLRQFASQATLRGRRKDKKQRRGKRSGRRRSRSNSRDRTDKNSLNNSSNSTAASQESDSCARDGSGSGSYAGNGSSAFYSVSSSSSNNNSRGHHRSQNSMDSTASSICSTSIGPHQSTTMYNQSSANGPQHLLDMELRNSLAEMNLDDEANSVSKNGTSPTTVALNGLHNKTSTSSAGGKGHRRSNSWSSNMFDGWEEKDENGDGPPSKTCMPNIFKRSAKKKIPCADVASVGNASDTILETGASGREMHEAAKVALNAGDFVTARNMFMAIQRAQLDRFGQDHPSVGAAMHNVGVVQLRMGHHQDAERTLQRAVSVRRGVFGSSHLDVAATLSKLGSARIVLLKFEEAFANLNEALTINRSQLGSDHKLVAQTLCQIACLYFEAGELEAAQVTFEDALDIFRTVFQQETVLYGETANVYNPIDTTNRDAIMSQITDTLCNVGSIQNKRKQHMEAIESFREALDLQRGIMGHDHPRVIATLDNLAYSYSKAKAYPHALSCYKEMLTAQISHYNNTFTEECCITLQKQNIMYTKLHQINDAIHDTKQALAKLYASSQTKETTQRVEHILQNLLLQKIKKDKKKKGCTSGCF